MEQYACSGRVDEVTALLDQLTGYANDSGLFAEEYNLTSRRVAGNSPQAFSHLGCTRAVDAATRARARP